MCDGVFSNKAAELSTRLYYKNGSDWRYFSVSFEKYFRQTFFQNTTWWLLGFADRAFYFNTNYVSIIWEDGWNINSSKQSQNLNTRFWSSHQRCSIQKGVLRNFTKFKGKHQCLFFNKVAGLGRAILLKKNFWHRCFPVNFVKFLRTPFYRTPLGDCFCLVGISPCRTRLNPYTLFL